MAIFRAYVKLPEVNCDKPIPMVLCRKHGGWDIMRPQEKTPMGLRGIHEAYHNGHNMVFYHGLQQL